MLRKDVVLRHDKTLCGERISVRQYGELGLIESGQCCCFVCVDSNLGTIIPSFGCDRDAVNCIISELRERVVKRGDAAQLEISKLVVAKTIEINDKMDIIARHLTGNQLELSTAPTVLTIDER
jgi:hypothetical protein